MQRSCVYRECMRNHAAKLGSYAIDGCREYSPPLSGDLCDACGCHRSYHRRVETTSSDQITHVKSPFTSLRRVKQLARLKRSEEEEEEVETEETSTEDQMTATVKRRRKSKFTAEQREAMKNYAAKLGWTLRDKRGLRDEIRVFCEGIGVSRYLFKTWVNNNKKFYH